MKPWPELDLRERWRLLLGEASATDLGDAGEETQHMDEALGWLYGRADMGGSVGAAHIAAHSSAFSDVDSAEVDDGVERHAGDHASSLTVPDWINAIHTLFPKETVERLERDALERYGLVDLVTQPEVLSRATPNPALLQAVLRTKHLMNPEVLAMARTLVVHVVKDLMEKLATQVRTEFSGKRSPHQLSLRGSSAQFAARATLQRNLRHMDPNTRRLVVHQPRFHVRHRRQLEPWQVLLLVDQSYSMLGSVIHAAVTAACLWALPGIKTHLIAFDTDVIDVSDQVGDPVELLMKVQLGGGTYIAKALGYAAELIEVPRRAIVVVISDFYEGMPEHFLIEQVRALTAQGSKVLGLAALDEQADPVYDRELAAKLVAAGAEIGAMTPGQLASWLAEKLT
jgi:Mg-chelatase subunit ChlD